MAHNKIKSGAQQLREYCWDFYQPGTNYGSDFFNNKLDKIDIRAAVRVLRQLILPRVNAYHRANPYIDCTTNKTKINHVEVGSYSYQREWIRDIILVASGIEVQHLDWSAIDYERSLISELGIDSQQVRTLFNKYYY
jgi:hypothetical protein